MSARKLARMHKIILEWGDRREVMYVADGVIQWTDNPKPKLRGQPLVPVIKQLREESGHVTIHNLSVDKGFTDLFPQITHIHRGGRQE